ncbi:hypothetical protein [Maribacter sp. 2308TA10-17]|uniref:hypothetical protein n=1 Tax=Maribacter sp. 2308TA10-17 TaxID=3386276 RepID=UPI0039BD7145
MKKNSLFILLVLLSVDTFSQNNSVVEAPKNVIHGSLGTAIALNSGHISYDRLLKQSENGFFKSYYLTAKAGGNFGIDFSGSNGATGNLFGVGVTALTGQGKNHFEVGLGLGYFMDTKNIVSASNPFGSSDESTFYPSVSIGYRKQTEKGFVFRTGVGIAEWAYFGFGYSF